MGLRGGEEEDALVKGNGEQDCLLEVYEKIFS